MACFRVTVVKKMSMLCGRVDNAHFSLAGPCGRRTTGRRNSNLSHGDANMKKRSLLAALLVSSMILGTAGMAFAYSGFDGHLSEPVCDRRSLGPRRPSGRPRRLRVLMPHAGYADALPFVFATRMNGRSMKDSARFDGRSARRDHRRTRQSCGFKTDVNSRCLRCQDTASRSRGNSDLKALRKAA